MEFFEVNLWLAESRVADVKTESVYSRTNFIVSKQNNGRSRGNAVTFSFISLRPGRFANVLSRFTNVLGQVR